VAAASTSSRPRDAAALAMVLVALQDWAACPPYQPASAPSQPAREAGGPATARWCSACFGSAYAVARVRDLDRADAVVLTTRARALKPGRGSSLGNEPVAAAGHRMIGPLARLWTAHARQRHMRRPKPGMDGRLEARMNSLWRRWPPRRSGRAGGRAQRSTVSAAQELA
jgi:hypothetical protein